jgi:hypothetical protein
MDHTEFDNILRDDIKIIFGELEKLIHEQYEDKGFQAGLIKNESIIKKRAAARKRAGWVSDKDALLFTNNLDESELSIEQKQIVELSRININSGQAFDERLKIRLLALKAVKKKISFSIERSELERLADYRYLLIYPALIFLVLICAILFYSPYDPNNITAFQRLSQILAVPIGLILFIIKTTFESTETSLVIMQKRRLEMIEQAIELTETKLEIHGPSTHS